MELTTIPLFGHLSDRVGRRIIYLVGCVAAICLSFLIFWAIETRDPVIVVLAFVIGMSVGHGIIMVYKRVFLAKRFRQTCAIVVRLSHTRLPPLLAADSFH